MSISTPAANVGFLEINVSNYTQAVISSGNPVMNIELIGQGVSKVLYISGSATAVQRTIDLTDIDYITADHRTSGTGTLTMTFTFS